MMLNSYRFGGPPFVGPLDAYTTNLWSAVSVRRLLTSWVGPSMTARNTTSGSTASIGFTPTGALDGAAISALAGANSVEATDFNTQIGASNHGFSAVATQRPLINNAGSNLSRLQFDGINDYFASGTNSGTPTGVTMFVKGKIRSTATSQIILEHSGNYNFSDSVSSYYDSGAAGVGAHKVSPAGYSVSNFGGALLDPYVQCFRWDRSQVSSGLQSVLFVNGVKQSRTEDTSSGTLPTGSIAASIWYIASRGGASIFSSLDLDTLLIYESALSDADCTAISNIVTALPSAYA